MHYAEAVALLRRIPVFATLDSATLKLLAFSSAYLTFSDGEALCREGDPADGVFVIDQGEVEVSVQVDNAPIRLASLRAHDLFGEMAVICNLPRTADVFARGPLKVLKIDGDVFLRMVTANPDAALGVMRVLTDRLIRLTELYERLKRSLPAGAGICAPGSSG